MGKQLIDGAIEYADGTPATASQMAKDVSVFLAWASEPDSDERKRAGLKWIVAVAAMVALTGYYKRFRCARARAGGRAWRPGVSSLTLRGVVARDSPATPPLPLISPLPPPQVGASEDAQDYVPRLGVTERVQA